MFHAIAKSEFAVRPAPLPASCTRIGRLLVVEDDLKIRGSIMAHLAEQQCTAVGCGALDVARHLQGPPLSLIIINARLGPLSGLDILRQIRERSHVPVILYRDKYQANLEPIIGLELGADDYCSGPLSPDELLARARAILRRQELGRRFAPQLRGGHRFHGWELRHSTRRLTSPAGEEVSLTKKEYALLSALLEAPDRPLSRLHLMRATRTHEDIYDRSIDVLVLRLRRKLACHPSGVDLIKTERGFGYIFDARVETLY
ncbi:winged helix-turn-helix domain-containing protein [Sphingomonas sp. ASY06-1R]|jgi:DNA-binding response OmpR family regulator|uniref:winged helix-turn-helix domain-containing protein n=1 Tax=Sphingomonas sp. ASY06-1R TaxID=3445771 RepID=UPI003FA2DC31